MKTQPHYFSKLMQEEANLGEVWGWKSTGNGGMEVEVLCKWQENLFLISSIAIQVFGGGNKASC